MIRTSPREQDSSTRRSRLTVLLIIAPTVIAVMALVGLAVWLILSPPFSGT